MREGRKKRGWGRENEKEEMVEGGRKREGGGKRGGREGREGE